MLARMADKHMATKTSENDLDRTDERLLEKLRALRIEVDKGEKAKAKLAPDVIGKLRGRGVDPTIIAEAYGVARSRVYQIPPVPAPV